MRRWAGLAVCTASVVVQAFLATAGAVEAPPLEAYGEMPRLEDAAISPDGKRTAAVIQDKGERRVLVLDETDKVLLNASAGTSKVRAIE